MATALVTGSAGLIGSEAVRHFARTGLDVVGIDNDMRGVFFGPTASTQWMRDELVRDVQDRKSTRLNSSHANISYAVFCLKKKKKTTKKQTHIEKITQDMRTMIV